MRYRLMASFQGASYQAGVVPTDEEVTLFAAGPPPEELGFRSSSNHWRKTVRVDDIDALWFGLFNPADEAGDATSGVYVAGTTRFHTIKTNPDWNVRPEYWPEGRYADSAVLRKIYRIAGNIDGAEYALCPAYAALAVAHLARSLDPKLLRGNRRERSLVVGFDDGDHVIVGAVAQDGFHPANSKQE